jgi:hypothetical protein
LSPVGDGRFSSRPIFGVVCFDFFMGIVTGRAWGDSYGSARSVRRILQGNYSRPYSLGATRVYHSPLLDESSKLVSA